MTVSKPDNKCLTLNLYYFPSPTNTSAQCTPPAWPYGIEQSSSLFCKSQHQTFSTKTGWTLPRQTGCPHPLYYAYCILSCQTGHYCVPNLEQMLWTATPPNLCPHHFLSVLLKPKCTVYKEVWLAIIKALVPSGLVSGRVSRT